MTADAPTSAPSTGSAPSGILLHRLRRAPHRLQQQLILIPCVPYFFYFRVRPRSNSSSPFWTHLRRPQHSSVAKSQAHSGTTDGDMPSGVGPRRLFPRRLRPTRWRSSKEHGEWMPRSVALAQVDSVPHVTRNRLGLIYVNPSPGCLYKPPREVLRRITLTIQPISTCKPSAASGPISPSP